MRFVWQPLMIHRKNEPQHIADILPFVLEMIRQKAEAQPVDYVDYYEYIQSPEWHLVSYTAKVNAGWRCRVCNLAGNYSNLHTHHRTYERLGNERPDDLTVLCADCHKLFHDNGKIAR